jgi:hypothetical protein
MSGWPPRDGRPPPPEHGEGPGGKPRALPEKISSHRQAPRSAADNSRTLTDLDGLDPFAGLRAWLAGHYAAHPDAVAEHARRLVVDEAEHVIRYAQIREQVMRGWPSHVLADIVWAGARDDACSLARRILAEREAALWGGR